MAKTIFRKLVRGLEKEIDKMPFGLKKRTLKRLVNKSLDRVIKKVGREYGIPNAKTEALKSVFWFCNTSFPDFDDKCYIEMMNGVGGWKLRVVGSRESER